MEASPPSNHLSQTISAGFSCFVVPLSNGNTRHYTLPLAGLMDDYLLSEGDGNLLQNEDATKDLSAATASHSLQYEDLFHSMIFSVDTRADVAMQLEKCTDSKCSESIKTTCYCYCYCSSSCCSTNVKCWRTKTSECYRWGCHDHCLVRWWKAIGLHFGLPRSCQLVGWIQQSGSNASRRTEEDNTLLRVRCRYMDIWIYYMPRFEMNWTRSDSIGGHTTSRFWSANDKQITFKANIHTMTWYSSTDDWSCSIHCTGSYDYASATK